MSSIASLLNNGYYGLDNQNTNGTNTQKSAIDLAAIAQTVAGAKTTSVAADSAYSLNLSADALAYIKSINGSSASAASSYGNANNFTLTHDQKTTLDSIIAKYKDAPFTQETFTKIQDDLEKAGLSTKILSLQDTIRNFNSTRVLLDALNGTSSTDSTLASLTGGTTTDTTAKSTNFMTSVADQWARISTTAKATKAS